MGRRKGDSRNGVDGNDEPQGLASLLASALTFPLPVFAASLPAIVLMMVWLFALGGEATPFAYAAYPACAYLLVGFITTCIRSVPDSKLKKRVKDSRLVQRFSSSRSARMRVSLVMGCVVDVAWACGNLALGIAHASVWLITLGCYYALLGTVRALLVRGLFKQAGLGGEVGSLRAERACGIILIVSILVLSGIITLVMTGNGTVYYSDWLIYAVAAFTFYSLISAIAGYVSRRMHKNPLERSNSAINLSIGLVSLFTLEIAMFASFAGSEDAQLVFVMPIITGSVVAALILLLGIGEIRKSL